MDFGLKQIEYMIYAKKLKLLLIECAYYVISYYQINHTLEDYYILADIKNIGFINPKNPINIKADYDNKIINKNKIGIYLFLSSSTSNLKIKYNILNPSLLKLN